MCDYPSNRREQLDTIENGKGIQYILDEAYRILGNPILVHDMEYKLTAHTANVITDDPIWNEFITTGTINDDILAFYKEESFFDAAANAKKTTFLISNKLKYDRIFGKLYTRYNVQFGCATMEECDEPFGNDDPKLFEVVCDILTRELSGDEIYQNYGQTYRGKLVGKLIEGCIDDKELYAANVADIYDGLEANLYLAVANITPCDSAHLQLTHFRDLFMRIQPAFKCSIYSNYIVIIMSTDKDTLNVTKDLIKFNKVLTEYKMYVGISSCFDNLFELQKYYNEAVNALNYGLETNGNQQIFLYDGARQNISEIFNSNN